MRPLPLPRQPKPKLLLLRNHLRSLSLPRVLLQLHPTLLTPLLLPPLLKQKR